MAQKSLAATLDQLVSDSGGFANTLWYVERMEPLNQTLIDELCDKFGLEEENIEDLIQEKTQEVFFAGMDFAFELQRALRAVADGHAEALRPLISSDGIGSALRKAATAVAR